MSLDTYNARLKHWISPRLALVYIGQLNKIYGDNFNKRSEFKKVFEARTAAITLLGIHKLTGTHFFMQVPPDIYDSPDIITANQREYPNKPVQLETQDVEIVDYGENVTEDLATFLIKKKLSPKKAHKAYDEKTIIICNL